MKKIERMKCKPCEGGVEPMKHDEVKSLLKDFANWRFIEGRMIKKEYTCRDFVSAIGLVNEIALIAENDGHHPDIKIHQWNKVTIQLWTHAIGGLSMNDFILASKIDRITINNNNIISKTYSRK